MNLPKEIAALLHAQSQFDSTAFANCFSETAVVFDEGKTHQGRNEIQEWNVKTNKEYQTVLEPENYAGSGGKHILTTRVSGTFDGSPIVVNYQFQLENGFIQSLKIV